MENNLRHSAKGSLDTYDVIESLTQCTEELETLRGSRTTTVVVTANGKVQTNEEAQVDIRDLGLFVTVQLLEDTPCRLGELCAEHGYSCEWDRRRNVYAQRTISYLWLFQGFLPVLVQVCLQHRYRRTRQVHLQVQHHSEVTDQHQETGARQTQ